MKDAELSQPTIIHDTEDCRARSESGVFSIVKVDELEQHIDAWESPVEAEKSPPKGGLKFWLTCQCFRKKKPEKEDEGDDESEEKENLDLWDDDDIPKRYDADGKQLCSQEGCFNFAIPPYDWCGGLRYCGETMSVTLRSADTKDEFVLQLLRYAGVRNAMRKLVNYQMGEKYCKEYPYGPMLYDHDQFQLWFQGKQLDHGDVRKPLVELGIEDNSLLVFTFEDKGHEPPTPEDFKWNGSNGHRKSVEGNGSSAHLLDSPGRAVHSSLILPDKKTRQVVPLPI